jgi:methylphosphotriester-DNA--protein-cysteine methyltransferase
MALNLPEYLMVHHSEIQIGQLSKLIRSGTITLAGNQRLKIYGTLSCSSGKRMNKQNRVFFSDEAEALQSGYRPCCHCLHSEYLRWKGQ